MCSISLKGASELRTIATHQPIKHYLVEWNVYWDVERIESPAILTSYSLIVQVILQPLDMLEELNASDKSITTCKEKSL